MKIDRPLQLLLKLARIILIISGAGMMIRPAVAAETNTLRPNIVLILADDMGIRTLAVSVPKFRRRTWTGWRRRAFSSANFIRRRAVV